MEPNIKALFGIRTPENFREYQECILGSLIFFPYILLLRPRKVIRLSHTTVFLWTKISLFLLNFRVDNLKKKSLYFKAFARRVRGYVATGINSTRGATKTTDSQTISCFIYSMLDYI